VTRSREKMRLSGFRPCRSQISRERVIPQNNMTPKPHIGHIIHDRTNIMRLKRLMKKKGLDVALLDEIVNQAYMETKRT